MAKALGLFLFAASLVPSQSAKEVTYEVDGTAAYATLTTINQNGGTEQNQVKLPFALKFYARGGQSVYLSAQKTRVATTYRGRESVIYDGVSGSVHVLIRVTGAAASGSYLERAIRHRNREGNASRVIRALAKRTNAKGARVDACKQPPANFREGDVIAAHSESRRLTLA